MFLGNQVSFASIFHTCITICEACPQILLYIDHERALYSHHGYPITYPVKCGIYYLPIPKLL